MYEQLVGDNSPEAAGLVDAQLPTLIYLKGLSDLLRVHGVNVSLREMCKLAGYEPVREVEA